MSYLHGGVFELFDGADEVGGGHGSGRQVVHGDARREEALP